MRRLSPADLLDLWEQGRPCHPVDRALLMLGAALPERPFEELAELPIGRRDAQLLETRRAWLGDRLEGVANCPACAAQLEFSLSAWGLAAATPPGDGASAVVAVGGERFRLPTSRDAAQIAHADDEEAAALQLLRACHVPAETSDGGKALERLTDSQIEEIGARMTAADPAADIRLALSCEACGHGWEETFDIGKFLWEEISVLALRLLHEVHVLARAYAWPEKDILAMSDARRETYLALVEA